jgi:hypothetical protein
MGEIAARTLLDRIEQRGNYLSAIAIEPEFVVRDSTGRAPAKPMAVRNKADTQHGWQTQNQSS